VSDKQLSYFVGLDLGQSTDYTALAVAEQHRDRRELRSGEKRVPTTYDIRHLQRFKLGTAYPDIVAEVAAMLRTEPLAGARCCLVADATGVGAPVMDLLRRANLPASVVGVTITGGDVVTGIRSDLRVPKRDLVSCTKVLLQAERLRFAELPDTPILVKELLSFKVKIDPRTAHDSYAAWREGVHDDLVLALCLACWYGEKMGQRIFIA
jgi:hypothetical protein